MCGKPRRARPIANGPADEQVSEREKPRRVLVEVGGVGEGSTTCCARWGFGEIVRPVNCGASPMDADDARTPRPAFGGTEATGACLEMWLKRQEWMEDTGGAPDQRPRRACRRRPCGPSQLRTANAAHPGRQGPRCASAACPSPDEWDAVALTFCGSGGKRAGWRRKLEYTEGGWVGVV